MSDASNRAVVTVVGLDQKGVIAKVATFLSDHSINILDISQTILDAYFTMVMIVDMKDSDLAIDDLSVQLQEKGNDIGMQITCQHADLFRYMHRL